MRENKPLYELQNQTLFGQPLRYDLLDCSNDLFQFWGPFLETPDNFPGPVSYQPCHQGPGYEFEIFPHCTVDTWDQQRQGLNDIYFNMGNDSVKFGYREDTAEATPQMTHVPAASFPSTGQEYRGLTESLYNDKHTAAYANISISPVWQANKLTCCVNFKTDFARKFEEKTRQTGLRRWTELVPITNLVSRFFPIFNMPAPLKSQEARRDEIVPIDILDVYSVYLVFKAPLI